MIRARAVVQVASLPDRSLMALAVGVALALYLPALFTGFSADDFFILSRVQEAGGLSAPLTYFRAGFFEFYRPLTFLSHAVDWEVWGLYAPGFHLTSLGLHAANTALVFLIGRRFTNPTGAFVAAVLFAAHPASHEAVYWIAARFDLLTTALTLAALLLLLGDRPVVRWAGALTFLLALLAKESAIALPVLAAASDLVLRGRDWKTTLRRLVPLTAALAAYVLLRSQAADLAPAGGRWMKLLVLAGVLGVLLGASWLIQRRRRPTIPGSAPGWIAVVAALLLGLLWWEPTQDWTQQKVGFAAFVAYFLLNPLSVLDAPRAIFVPDTPTTSLPGLAVILGVMAGAWRARRWIAAHPPMLFAGLLTVAALIPVLSLTGSPRYVYLPTAGMTLAVGYVVGTLTLGRWRALAVVAALVLVGGAQSFAAASNWRWSSGMVDRGLALMAAQLAPCGTRDAILLTAPVGIRQTYSNFYWDAFPATGRCAPASLFALLRVMRQDADVRVALDPDGQIRLEVPEYAGTFRAARDLRTFDVEIPIGSRLTIDTEAGTLETWPDGRTQIFRLNRSARAAAARLFYYSAGELRSAAQLTGRASQ